MPVQTYVFLLISVIAAAGATVALVTGLGGNLAWLGLGALVLAFALRKVRP